MHAGLAGRPRVKIKTIPAGMQALNRSKLTPAGSICRMGLPPTAPRARRCGRQRIWGERGDAVAHGPRATVEPTIGTHPAPDLIRAGQAVSLEPWPHSFAAS